jgi:hypothetical protein
MSTRTRLKSFCTRSRRASGSAGYDNNDSRIQTCFRRWSMSDHNPRGAADVRYGSISAEIRCLRHVRSAPNNGLMSDVAGEKNHHSNTSSARTSTDGGMAMPSAFAVLAFTASSNLVGCSTGRSAGFAPLRTLTTIVPACRHIAVRLTP